MRQLLEEDPGGEGLASEQTLQILRRVATGGTEKSVIAYADTIVEEAAGSAPPYPLPPLLCLPRTYLSLILVLAPFTRHTDGKRVFAFARAQVGPCASVGRGADRHALRGRHIRRWYVRVSRTHHTCPCAYAHMFCV